MSPSDCQSAGPYVAGVPVSPDGSLKVRPLEHSVLDHADPAGQHTVIQEVLDHADPAGQHAVVREMCEPLVHSVLDTALDGRPMEGIPALEPLEHSVLEMFLDGGPLEEMSGTGSAFGSECNPGQSTYGGDTRSGTVRTLGSGDGLDSGLTEGMSHLEPLEHSVLNAALVA